MAANTIPIFPKSVNTSAITITNSDANTAKQIMVAGANGSRLDGISACNDDTNAHDIQLVVYDGVNDFVLGTVPVFGGSGMDSSHPPEQLLARYALPWLDSSGSIFLKTGWSLRLKSLSTVSSGKALTFVAFYGDY